MHRCPAPRVRDAVARRHIARDRGRARRRGADAARKRCEQNSSARCATREGDARDATRATRRRRWTNTFRERAGTREARARRRDGDGDGDARARGSRENSRAMDATETRGNDARARGEGERVARRAVGGFCRLGARRREETRASREARGTREGGRGED